MTSIPASRQSACDDLGAPVVAVKSGLRDDDTNLARHETEYMSLKLTVVGCSPAWPNPGGAQSGYLLERPGRLLLDCGPGVLAKLREREPGRASTQSRSRTGTSTTGAIWSRGFGASTLGPGRESIRPSSGCPGGRELLCAIGQRLGRPEMFERAFDLHEYEEGKSFEAAGFEVTPHRVLHYDLVAFGFRASANGTDRRLLRRLRSERGLREIARNADLFVCEATLLQPEPEGGTRGHLSAVEALEASRGGRGKAAAADAPPPRAPARERLRARVRRARDRRLGARRERRKSPRASRGRRGGFAASPGSRDRSG